MCQFYTQECCKTCGKMSVITCPCDVHFFSEAVQNGITNQLIFFFFLDFAQNIDFGYTIYALEQNKEEK